MHPKISKKVTFSSCLAIWSLVLGGCTFANELIGIKPPPEAKKPSTVVISGQLTPPRGTSPQNFTIVNALESTKPDINGGFSVAVRTNGVTVTAAVPQAGSLGSDNENIYMAVTTLQAGLTSHIQINAQSTAEALVFLAAFATRNPSDALYIMNIIRSDRKVAVLAEFIERIYPITLAPLEHPELEMALFTAVESVLNSLSSVNTPISLEFSTPHPNQQVITLAQGGARQLVLDLELTTLNIKLQNNRFSLKHTNKEGVSVDWQMRLVELDASQIDLRNLSIASNRTVFPRLSKGLNTSSIIESRTYFEYVDVIDLAINFLSEKISSAIEEDKGIEIPSNKPGIYLIRAYSGGGWLSNDSEEWGFIWNEVPDGDKELILALTWNLFMAAIDAIDLLADIKSAFKNSKNSRNLKFAIEAAYEGCVQTITDSGMKTARLTIRFEDFVEVARGCFTALIREVMNKAFEWAENRYRERFEGWLKNILKKGGKLIFKFAKSVVSFFLNWGSKIRAVGSIINRIYALAGLSVPYNCTISGWAFWQQSKCDWGQVTAAESVIILVEPNQSLKPPYFNVVLSGVDVILVLDRSGSMQGDKIRLTKEAASIFISLMNPGDRIGVISFSDYATLDYPLTEIGPEGFQRDQARDAIRRLTADGSTSIGDGLWQAANQLRSSADPNRRQAIVLFTDGGENRDPCVHEVLPLIPKMINIYTVSLGKLVQETRSECPPEDPEILLRKIARSFNGWHSASATLVELQALYAELAGTVTGRRKPVQQLAATIKPGERQEKTVLIDPYIKKVSYSTYWAGSDLGFYLKTPDGSVITPETATASSVRYREGPTFKSYEIESPQPGTWTMIIEGRDVPSQGELYVVQVSGESSISLAVDFDREDYSPGQPVTLRATLDNNGLPVTTAIVQARIELLESSVSRFPKEIRLYDDGQHDDGLANDGIFGGRYMPSYGGVYRVAVEAVGTIDLVQPFARMTQRTFYVSEGR